MKHGLMPAPTTAQRCGRVAVLMGGCSAERAVSLRSGDAVHAALIAAGVDAFKLDIQTNVVQDLLSLEADCVFNILHGRMGEDGRLQAVLELLGLPYTGSGVCASALGQDKQAAKRVFLGSSIPTPDYRMLHSETDCVHLADSLGFPVFVKPTLEGSSIGMSRVDRIEQLVPAWQRARAYGPVLAEKLVSGMEYTAGFLGDQVLPLIRLETPRAFYDYEAKYVSTDTRYICPCGLDAGLIAEINALIKQTIVVMGLRHWGRVDFMLDEKKQPWIIEVNTAPGMTDHSLVPMAARQVGLEMPDLVLKILQLSLDAGADHA